MKKIKKANAKSSSPPKNINCRPNKIEMIKSEYLLTVIIVNKMCEMRFVTFRKVTTELLKQNRSCAT